jgi:hypothetical protein
MEVQLQHIHNVALEVGGWSAPCSGCFTPRKDPVPTVEEARWTLGMVWMTKNLASAGNDPQTSQTVASYYTMLS